MGADGISGPSGGGLPQKGIQPGAAASGGIRIGEISGLKPGDLFEAKILGALSDTEALLDIGGGAVTAKTPFSFSGMEGEGVLLKGGKPVAYYNTAGVSTGLQIGAQTYGYAMFFMNDASVKSLDRAEGFEVGVGPS
nr:hypothetical protein [Nitrospiraceae bacterium]